MLTGSLFLLMGCKHVLAAMRDVRQGRCCAYHCGPGPAFIAYGAGPSYQCQIFSCGIATLIQTPGLLEVGAKIHDPGALLLPR